jgi:2-methylcitrate dehydratase PrpD
MLFTPLDATRALIEEHCINAADVQSMEIEIYPHALKIAGVQWPAKPAEASFCLRYVLAVLLQKGTLGVADTEVPDIDNPTLRALAARITVRPNDEFQQAFPQRRPSRVRVTLHDGRHLTAYRDLRRGDPEDPYTWDGMQQRMRTFAPAMNDAQAAALVAWCEDFTDAGKDATASAPSGALFGKVRTIDASPGADGC